MKEVKLSNIQLGLLTFGFLYGSTAILNPAMGAKRDAWIALILGWFTGFIFILGYLYISKLNQGKTLNEILEECFGKVLGKLAIAFYILFFLYKAVINIRGFGEFMAIVSYPETPLIFLMSVFMLAVIYVVKSGLATIGRLAEMLVPLMPIPILVVASSMVTMKNYSGFQPVLLEIAPVIKGAAGVVSTIFGDFILFLMVLPYTNKVKGRFKSSLLALMLLGVLLMIIVVRNLIVIGPVLIEHFIYAAHVSAQLVPGMNIDPLVDVNLLLGGGFKVALCLYAVTKATAELFKVESYKPLVSAFAVLAIVLAFWIIPSSIELRRWSGSLSIILVTIPAHVILPLAMLIVSIIKQSKKRKNLNTI
ncbi:MAG: endospore germination permease [Clostridia bacterium]|nr:endospore germination permease [Clostridia bacterium]